MVGAPVRVPITEDFTITVEVKRVNGETWMRALIDGHEPAEVETMAALVTRVLPGLIKFVVKHGRHVDPDDDDGEEDAP